MAKTTKSTKSQNPPARIKPEDTTPEPTTETPPTTPPDVVPPSNPPARITNEEESESKPEEVKKHSWLEYEAPDKNGNKIKIYTGKAAVMRKKLMSEPEVMTFIPRNDGEVKSIPEIVNLNRYKLNIPKDTYVSLPKQVADIIMNSRNQVKKVHDEINATLGIDRDSASSRALN